MMAKLTMTDGCSFTIHNLALFRPGADSAIEEPPGRAASGAQEPDRCEFTFPRKAWAKMRYFTQSEIELPDGEVFTLTDLELIRDSHGSPNVRVRSRVKKGG